MSFKNYAVKSLASTASVFAFTVAAAGSAHAVEAAAAASVAMADEPQEIVITGSRIARVGTENSTPVSIISAERLESSGAVALEDALTRQPQFAGGMTSRSNNPGTGAATINLRGLGANRNLVLVNGRRYIFTGSDMVTDINTIPAALVERVDIVTGGSSAVYGSDAISGVTNFVLRDDFHGAELRAQVGGDSRGDALTQNYDLTLGRNFADGRGNIVVSGNYYKRGSVLNGDREFSRIPLTDGTVNGQPALTDRLSINSASGAFQGLPFGAAAGDAANADLVAAMQAAGIGSLATQGFTFDSVGAAARPFNMATDRYNIATLNYLQTPAERYGLASFAHFEVSDAVTLYAEGAYYRTNVNMQLAGTNINRDMTFDVDNPYLSAAMQEVFRQKDMVETGANQNDGLVNLKVARRFNELGPRGVNVTRDVYRIGGGVRGKLPSAGEGFLYDTSFDVSYFYAQSDSTTEFTNMISQSRLWSGVLRGADGADPIVNLFGAGSLSQAAADHIRVNGSSGTSTRAHNVMASLSSTLLDLPAGPAGVALGMEYRDATAINSVDENIGSFDIIGQDPMFANRGSINVWDIFGELRLPLLSEASPIGKVTANGAFRYSTYSIANAKNVFTYLGGLEWSPVRDLNLRGQWQHAVRAPNIGELYSGQYTNRLAQMDPCATTAAVANGPLRDLCIATGVPANVLGDRDALQPSGQIDALFGSNADLSVEKSNTLSFGFTYTPQFLRNFSLAVDYFRIDIKDAIAPLAGGVASIFDLCYNVLQDVSNPVCQAINRGSDGTINDPNYVVAANSNIGRMKTSGIDLALAWAVPMNFGFGGDSSRLSLDVNGTWLHSFDSTPLQYLPDQVNECLGGFGGICGDPRSKIRANTRLSWTSAGFTLGVTHRFIGGVTDGRIVIAENRGDSSPNHSSFAVPTIGDQHYVDLSLRFDVPHSNLSLYGGVNNLLDKQPPIMGSAQQQANTWPSTYDALGAEYFLGAKFKF